MATVEGGQSDVMWGRGPLTTPAPERTSGEQRAAGHPVDLERIATGRQPAHPLSDPAVRGHGEDTGAGALQDHVVWVPCEREPVRVSCIRYVWPRFD